MKSKNVICYIWCQRYTLKKETLFAYFFLCSLSFLKIFYPNSHIQYLQYSPMYSIRDAYLKISFWDWVKSLIEWIMEI